MPYPPALVRLIYIFASPSLPSAPHTMLFCVTLSKYLLLLSLCLVNLWITSSHWTINHHESFASCDSAWQHTLCVRWWTRKKESADICYLFPLKWSCQKNFRANFIVEKGKKNTICWVFVSVNSELCHSFFFTCSFFLSCVRVEDRAFFAVCVCVPMLRVSVALILMSSSSSSSSLS